jgi:hypothetical protein
MSDFSINPHLKTLLPMKKTFIPKRALNAKQARKVKQRETAARKKTVSSQQQKKKRNLCMRCTAPFVFTFLRCLTGCGRWKIVAKKPLLMNWRPTGLPAWRCSYSQRVLVINTTSTERTYSFRRATNVCLVLMLAGLGVTTNNAMSNACPHLKKW